MTAPDLAGFAARESAAAPAPGSVVAEALALLAAAAGGARAALEDDGLPVPDEERDLLRGLTVQVPSGVLAALADECERLSADAEMSRGRTRRALERAKLAEARLAPLERVAEAAQHLRCHSADPEAWFALWAALDAAPAAPGEHPVATAERARCAAVCRAVAEMWRASIGPAPAGSHDLAAANRASGAEQCAETLERLSPAPAERG